MTDHESDQGPADAYAADGHGAALFANERSMTVETALDALVSLLQTQRTMGRERSTAAGVSSAMRKAPGFDLQAMGFSAFRELLREGERRDVLEVTWPERGSGLDAYVWLPGEARPVRPQPSPTTRIPHVRGELWRAFMRWSLTTVSYWDRDRATVIEVPIAGAGTRADDAIASGVVPATAVPIEPIDESTQLAWMTQFTASLTPGSAEATMLTSALRTPRPLAAYTSAVKQLSPAGAQWRRAQVEHVIAHIEAWKSANGVVLDVVPDSIAGDVRPGHAAAASSTTMTDDEIRERVVAAVRAMPIADVLALTIRVQYLLRR